tara:strand:- start:384 stop:875 length:492 start_codon:yes stop_codon:yes gene_type:complete
MTIFIKNKYRLIFEDFSFKCAIGKNGISRNKVEGDKKTPKGWFDIEHLYYRKDRIKKPITNLRCIEIKKNMGWCDNPNSTSYNKLIKIKNHVKYEKLFRRDNKYNLIIPIKYNFKKPIKNKGSCIFLHLTNNYKPTAGCIVLKQNDFLILLKLINKKSKIKIS